MQFRTVLCYLLTNNNACKKDTMQYYAIVCDKLGLIYEFLLKISNFKANYYCVLAFQMQQIELVNSKLLYTVMQQPTIHFDKELVNFITVALLLQLQVALCSLASGSKT